MTVVRELNIAPPAGNLRGFRLTVLREPDRAGDGYGLRLEETYADTLAVTVVAATAGRVRPVLDAVVSAVRSSAQAPSVLSPSRTEPVVLDEPSGVRLALVLLSTAPLRRKDRMREIANGIAAMSVEETYYWYAACRGPSAPRARKALRILLAGD